MSRTYRKSQCPNPDLKGHGVVKEPVRSNKRFNYTGNAVFLSRGFSGFSVSVLTTATSLFVSPYEWTYIIMNPNRSFAGDPLILYIGGPGVTVTSGFPLVENTYQYFIIEEGMEVFAVAEVPLTINVMKV